MRTGRCVIVLFMTVLVLMNMPVIVILRSTLPLCVPDRLHHLLRRSEGDRPTKAVARAGGCRVFGLFHGHPQGGGVRLD
jgi:hypothetical protein